MKPGHFFYFLASTALVISITVVVFLLASGYRFNTETRTIQGTGIISINSVPDGALVYINDVPKNATNTSITDLTPGGYSVRLNKEGYHSWQQSVIVKKELVTKLEALLLPQYPTLQPLTFTGVISPVISPDGQKIIYTVDTGTSTGIWLIDLEERPFNLSRKPQLLLADTAEIIYSKSTYTWSPDSNSIMIEFPSKIISKDAKYQIYNLSTSTSTFSLDITATQGLWNQQIATRELDRLLGVNTNQQESIKTLKIIQWSFDNKYLLYQKTDGTKLSYYVLSLQPIDIPTIQQPSPTSTDNPETLVFETNSTTPHSIKWYPDSKHVIITEFNNASSSISFVEITGENKTQLFSGDIKDLVVYPNLNGSKVINLTKFNAEISNYNLYSIDLR